MELTKPTLILIIIVVDFIALVIALGMLFTVRKYARINRDNTHNRLNKNNNETPKLIISIITVLLGTIFNIISFQCVDSSIDFSHDRKLYNNDTISIVSPVFLAQIYYTIDNEPVQEKSVLYNKKEKIKVSDLDLSKLDLKGNDNKFTIYCQLKLLNVFWIGQVQQKEYQLLYDFNPVIECFDDNTISENTIFNAPMPIGKLSSFESIYINNQSDTSRSNRLCDGNTETFEGFISYCENCIEFTSSENKKIQTIYIHKAFQINKILIKINGQTKECIIPYYGQDKILIQINLGDIIYTDNIILKFYTHHNSTYFSMSDITFTY